MLDTTTAPLPLRAAIILDIASRPHYVAGGRDADARKRLGLTPTQYAQELNDLLDDERALAYDPITVNRLRRIRDAALARKGHSTQEV